MIIMGFFKKAKPVWPTGMDKVMNIICGFRTIIQKHKGKTYRMNIAGWFRSLKCDNIYINEYSSPCKLRCGISGYICEYNTERPHQNLDYKYPVVAYATKSVT